MGAIEQRYVLSNLLHLLPASSLRPPFLDVHRALHLDRKMPTPGYSVISARISMCR
jgi:hypothetical protein